MTAHAREGDASMRSQKLCRPYRRAHYGLAYTVVVSSGLQICSACSFSSPTPGGATGWMPPQRWQAALWLPGRHNIAIILSLAERIVDPGRACAKPSFRCSPSPRPSLSSLHWEQVRLGPSCPLCAAQARGIQSLARMLLVPCLACSHPGPHALPLCRYPRALRSAFSACG